ncbi:hypothetical protein ACO0LF_16760 [Undibacterium sp. Di27W]|uniref:hypothetical protein n=1 Tax=Undibacterium sp. Di27W TaxID=3413036 RepID=UPI003BF08B3C
MQLLSILHGGAKALDAVSESFAPKPGASSSDIRKNGLLCLAIGLLCVFLSISLIFVKPMIPALMMLPILLSYAFMIVGAYRAIFGKTPKPAYPGELSIKRVSFAVITIVFFFGAIAGLVSLGSWLYELLYAGA